MTTITDLTSSDVCHYVRDHFYSSDTFFGQRTLEEIPHLPARYGDTCIVCGIPAEQLKVDGKPQFHKDGTPVMVPGTAIIDGVSVRNGDWLVRAPGWTIIDSIMEKDDDIGRQETNRGLPTGRDRIAWHGSHSVH